MLVPLSWLKDFVEISLPLDELAHLLTMAGLEVVAINYVGIPLPEENGSSDTGEHKRPEAKISGLEWERDKIVVGSVLEVMPHPNADRLVLCRLFDGDNEHTVLTGAPNLYPYKGIGPLDKPLMVPYAKEGARIFDGHQPGQVVTKLKKTKIRGVESSSMICSEKELGISDDHEGIIILDGDAVPGTPLVDYMGDVVLDIDITPNISRTANILGVAREVAALTDQPLQPPKFDFVAEGPPIENQVSVEITDPELNPRFVFGLIRDVEIKPSPYEVQRRLLLAGMRPIYNIVDATNYAMLEMGQPLHAFDYDILSERVGGKAPHIITRPAMQGERLTTLDGEMHTLQDFTVLVCDTEGALAMAGVMGGEESEVNEDTRNVLLEGANWNYINTRRTVVDQRMSSEAAYRFARGMHPSLSELGVKRGLELMRIWSNGVVASGLIDEYPLPAEAPIVQVSVQDVHRWLGINLSVDEITGILKRLEFNVEIEGDSVKATAPDHRVDIGEGVTGVADLMEEIARVYGYERIPETRLADELPPQLGNPRLEKEELVRELLKSLGLQEVVNYRLTSTEREARLTPDAVEGREDMYVHLANPIASDRDVLRRSLLSSVMEVIERNSRIQERLELFEIGPVFVPGGKENLPRELLRLSIALTGPRSPGSWGEEAGPPQDFFDLKGIVSELLAGLRIEGVGFVRAELPGYHPGKCALVEVEGSNLGYIGELHPLVHEQFDLSDFPVQAAEFDLDAIFDIIPGSFEAKSVPVYPPVLEDLAIIVDEEIPAERVLEVLEEAGGRTLVETRLFDVFRGKQIGQGKKSLAYSLSYQAPDRTLTDEEVAKIRSRIVRRLDKELDAKLRS